MLVHNLAGKTQADTGTRRLGCEERHEYLLLTLLADCLTIVCDLDYGLLQSVHARLDGDILRTGFGGILDKIHKNLRQLTLIGIDEKVRCCGICWKLQAAAQDSADHIVLQ